MRVYRVEHMSILNHVTGAPAGPYADLSMAQAEHYEGWSDWDDEDLSMCDGDCIHEQMTNMSWKTDGRPMPSHEGIGDVWQGSPFHFAFATPQQLRDWFVGDLRWMDAAGFVVAVYEVPDSHTQHGRRQSVFDYTVSKRLFDLPLLQYRSLG